MKLNLGCGHNKIDGFVNVDASPVCAPDEVVDLEALPWPWPDSSAEHVVFHHSLEHMGGDPKLFLRLMQELYRVCAAGAQITVTVPHPRHDNFLGDPTHVRPITPDTLALFDRALNDEWQARGVANSPLAHYTGVDFHIEQVKYVVDQPWDARRSTGELSDAGLRELIRTHNNVVREITVELRVRK